MLSTFSRKVASVQCPEPRLSLDESLRLFPTAIGQDYGKHGRLKTFSAMELRQSQPFGGRRPNQGSRTSMAEV